MKQELFLSRVQSFHFIEVLSLEFEPDLHIFFQPTRGQWQKVLFVSAAVSFFGGIFYLIFAKGEEQEWNKANPSDLPTNRDIKDLVEEDEGETSPFIDSQ